MAGTHQRNVYSPGELLVNDTSRDVFYVDDINGNNRGGRTQESAFASIQDAIDSATNGRATVINIMPGQYSENVNVNKRPIALVGTGRHPGMTRITGDGSTARASVYVGDGFLSGFQMFNLGVDTGDVDTTSQIRPCIHLVTNDTAALGALSVDYHFTLNNVHIVSDTIPSAGVLLEGASVGFINDCIFAGVDIGIAIGGSLNNVVADVIVNDAMFYNNVVADVATVNNVADAHPSAVFVAGTTIGNLESFIMRRPYFMDRGGTPVTNYVNIATADIINCGIYDFWAARDVADATLMQLPVDMIALGHSAAGVESIIGA